MGRFSRKRAKKEAHTKLGKARPLETFFSSYTDFAFNPEAPSRLEFRRLSKEQGWKRGDAVGEAAWQDFRSALVLEFNARFGTELKDLLTWQTLCAIVGIEEVNKIADCEACEKLLKSRLFNLVDVIDTHRRSKGEVVQTFASAEALKEHTKKTAAFFPHYHVAAGSLLKRVLRKPPSMESLNTTNG
ncbi:hypothetical protein P154DRAFT_625930 [Amniculicola lignicola CBS 123094]|uniref:Uncharacterized protein n=1 Tax=Amniculicola lignicola CBS 123094 TaxID=1392246 RepID=A0A6A5W4Y2_9PLEO|nr:hypothetical protein P154DRAFT_625930 [Amniculicola lignicola CBS 123094]